MITTNAVYFVQIHGGICYAVSFCFFAFPASFAYLLSTFPPQKSPILKASGFTFLIYGLLQCCEVVVKKAPIPKDRGFALKVILLILFLSDVVCFPEYLAMQKQFRVVCFVYS